MTSLTRPSVFQRATWKSCEWPGDEPHCACMLVADRDVSAYFYDNTEGFVHMCLIVLCGQYCMLCLLFLWRGIAYGICGIKFLHPYGLTQCMLVTSNVVAAEVLFLFSQGGLILRLSLCFVQDGFTSIGLHSGSAVPDISES